MKWSARKITFYAMMLALALILEIISQQILIFKMSSGGSITLAAVPLLLVSYYDHWEAGILVALMFAFLQGLISPFFVVHPLQFLLDYPLAFGVMPLATLGLKETLKKGDWSQLVRLEIGILIAFMVRLFFHVFSGVLFFSEGAMGPAVWTASLAYNLTYMVPTTVYVMLVFPVLLILLPNKKIKHSH